MKYPNSLSSGSRQPALLLLCVCGRVRVAWLGLLLAFAAPLVAADSIVTNLSTLKKVVTKTADGRSVETLVPFKTMLPGEEAMYVLEYSNIGDAPATGVMISLPVPVEMTFIPGSADLSQALTAYSVDGRNYGPLEKLTVTSAGGLVRPAGTQDIRGVQWTLKTALAAGEKGTVSFRAILK